jgi:hypothetical protein
LLVIAFDPETLLLDTAQFKDFNLHVENSGRAVTLGGGNTEARDRTIP